MPLSQIAGAFEKPYYDLLLCIVDAIRGGVQKQLDSFTDRMRDGYLLGGSVYAFGNGGSASQADHLVGELLGAFEDRSRPSLRALSLSSQTASLTAIANDFGYDQYPARFVDALNQNDSLILLSTSGTSKNIVAVFDRIRGRQNAPKILLICGKKFLDSEYAALPSGMFDRIVLPSKVTSTVQEATLFFLHRIAALFERKMKP